MTERPQEPGHTEPGAFYLLCKRFLDIVGALTGLTLLSPLLVSVAIAVRFKMGAPVFFRQERPGLAGKSFGILKFRTMREAMDASGAPLSDHERLTKLGRFIRSASIDELPELLNVLRGEMTLVGPRPLLPRYLPRYTPRQNRRHEMKPGITGWAQVNGRNAISWEEKFELDVWYVENCSLLLDIKILFLTVLSVIKRKDINAGAESTMPEFMGSEREEEPSQ